MANLSVNIPGLASPIVTTVGAAPAATPAPTATPSPTMVPDTLPPVAMPDTLQQSTDIDIGEAAVPTVAEPLPPGEAAGKATDVYVAPMSNAKQKLWQKIMCIGCCVPDN